MSTGGGIDPRAIAGGLAAAAGLLAVGAAAGVVAERAVVAKSGRADREADEPYGKLRGTPLEVHDSTGGTLHVEVEECTRDNPEGITLVFSHGYALNQDCWHYQRRDLRAVGRLVFWDQRSHGRSHRSLPETNTIEQLGRDLYEVIGAVVPEGPIILVGHSMGGMTIMQLALAHPELFGSRVRGLALLSTSPGGLRDVPLLRREHAEVVDRVDQRGIQPVAVLEGAARLGELAQLPGGDADEVVGGGLGGRVAVRRDGALEGGARARPVPALDLALPGREVGPGRLVGTSGREHDGGQHPGKLSAWNHGHWGQPMPGHVPGQTEMRYGYTTTPPRRPQLNRSSPARRAASRAATYSLRRSGRPICASQRADS